MEKILVVDDELSMREFLEILLSREGYAVDAAQNGLEAIAKIGECDYDLIITDIQMPKANGLEVLDRAKQKDPAAMVIMITAYGSTDTAVEAMKKGAYDYITKPFQVDEIKLIIQKALEKNRLLKDNLRLRKEVESKYQFENIIGASEPMRDLFSLINSVAPTRSNVLIEGESGTGKELVARAIHYNSPRADKPFVTINCGAIPADLLESELFGHLRGSFTGAYADKRGLLEAAQFGTILLDEIGETPLAIQVKLLRAIQEKTFKPVGGTQDVRVDVRVIAATNQDLEDRVAKKAFREDLYYRLNVIKITMPPLRHRRDDIPLLVQHFIRRLVKEVGKEISGIDPEAERLIMAYDWPGNVRELENTIERAISLTHSDRISAETLPDRVKKGAAISAHQPTILFPDEGLDLETTLQQFEQKLIEEALRRSRGVKKQAAKLLHVSFRSFRYRLEKLGIDDGKDE